MPCLGSGGGVFLDFEEGEGGKGLLFVDTFLSLDSDGELDPPVSVGIGVNFAGFRDDK